MNKILVPVDGSKPSIRALEYAAARIAGRKGMEIHVLYAQRPVMPTAMMKKWMIDQWHAQGRKKTLSGTRFKTLLKSIGARVHIETDEPAVAILDFARKNGTSEIVMGTRGLGRLKGLMIGSVATKVSHLAEVPVTLVK